MKAIVDPRRDKCKCGASLVQPGKPYRGQQCFDCVARQTRRSCSMSGDIYGTGEYLSCTAMAEVQNTLCSGHYKAHRHPFEKLARERGSTETLAEASGPFSLAGAAALAAISIETVGPYNARIVLDAYAHRLPASIDTIYSDAMRDHYTARCDRLAEDMDFDRPRVPLAKRIEMASRQGVASDDEVGNRRYKCAYCGLAHRIGLLTVEHVIPWRRYRIHQPWNIVQACWECQSIKGDRPVITLFERLADGDSARLEALIARFDGICVGHLMSAELPDWTEDEWMHHVIGSRSVEDGPAPPDSDGGKSATTGNDPGRDMGSRRGR